MTGLFKGWANFGNLPQRADGSGLVVDLGSVQDVSEVQASMYRPGQTAEVLAADPEATNPTTLNAFTKRLSKLEKAGSSLTAKLDKPVKTRYVLVHITELPSDDEEDGYRGGISEIKVSG